MTSHSQQDEESSLRW